MASFNTTSTMVQMTAMSQQKMTEMSQWKSKLTHQRL